MSTTTILRQRMGLLILFSLLTAAAVPTPAQANPHADENTEDADTPEEKKPELAATTDSLEQPSSKTSESFAVRKDGEAVNLVTEEGKAVRIKLVEDEKGLRLATGDEGEGEATDEEKKALRKELKQTQSEAVKEVVSGLGGQALVDKWLGALDLKDKQEALQKEFEGIKKRLGDKAGDNRFKKGDEKKIVAYDNMPLPKEVIKHLEGSDVAWVAHDTYGRLYYNPKDNQLLTQAGFYGAKSLPTDSKPLPGPPELSPEMSQKLTTMLTGTGVRLSEDGLSIVPATECKGDQCGYVQTIKVSDLRSNDPAVRLEAMSHLQEMSTLDAGFRTAISFNLSKFIGGQSQTTAPFNPRAPHRSVDMDAIHQTLSPVGDLAAPSLNRFEPPDSRSIASLGGGNINANSTPASSPNGGSGARVSGGPKADYYYQPNCQSCQKPKNNGTEEEYNFIDVSSLWVRPSDGSREYYIAGDGTRQYTTPYKR